MPHIHTKRGQHDHTVSAYIVRLDGKEPRLLLHRHKKLKVLMQFGGHIELDETPWQAIVHELQEESGYHLDQLLILQPKDRIAKLTGGVSHPQPVNQNTHPYDKARRHFHSDTVYAFVTTKEPKHQPKHNESNDFQLLTRAELLAVPPGDILEIVREIGLFIFDTCLNSWDQVPAKTINQD